MISDEYFSMIFNKIDTLHNPPLLNTWATLKRRNKDDVKRIVVITPFSMMIFKEKAKNLQLEDTSYFFEIESIKSKQDIYTIKFFDKVYTFVGDSAKGISEMVVSQVLSIFYPEEVPNVRIPNLSFDSSVPTPYNRFYARLIAKGRVPPDNILNDFQDSISHLSSNFDISKVNGLSDYVDGVFSAIEVAPNVTHITIPHTNFPKFWASLTNFLKKNKTVEWLTISNVPGDDDDFPNFCAVFKDNDNETVQHIEFKDIIVEERALNTLVVAFSSRELISLSFNHCAFDFSEKMVAINIGNIRKRSKIREIGFASTYFIKRTELLESLFIMNSLSLCGCSIELSQLFSYTSKLRCAELDFSSNPATVPFTKPVEIPQTTSRISLNGIEWKADMLIEIIKATAKAHLKPQINIANATFKEGELDKFDSEIGKVDPGNIDGFSWNNNELTSGVISFIQKGNINFIGLAGIPFPPNLSFFSNLGSEYLDIHGTDNCKLGSRLPSVITALANSKVTFVNVSHNDCGAENMDKLIKAITEYPTLRCINIDDNKFTTMSCMKKFVQNFKDMKKLYVYVPHCDLSAILKNAQPSRVLDLSNQFHHPKAKRSERGASGNEWEIIIKEWYPENDMHVNPDEIPPIEAPNSDYCIEEEEEVDEIDENDTVDIWKYDVMVPPENMIEKIQSRLSDECSIPKLVDKIIQSQSV